VSILSDFEDRVGSAIEGMFAGVFRSPVQPAELARAAAREMDRRKKLGVGKVYAPTMFSVLLSAQDGEQLGGFADTLAGELSTYLLAHARERGYELAHRPVVRFLVDDDLKLGRYVIIGELLSPEEIAAEMGGPAEDNGYYRPGESAVQMPSGPPVEAADAAVEPAPGAHSPAADLMPPPVTTAVFDAEDPGAADGPWPGSPLMSTITIPGVAHDVVLRGDRLVVGRLKSCDVCLNDANTSRKHAVFEREGAGWAVVDLGSMNGTRVNGAKVSRVRLRDGDTITIGISELVYHEPRG
jgi:hypothetical protein